MVNNRDNIKIFTIRKTSGVLNKEGFIFVGESSTGDTKGSKKKHLLNKHAFPLFRKNFHFDRSRLVLPTLWFSLFPLFPSVQLAQS